MHHSSRVQQRKGCTQQPGRVDAVRFKIRSGLAVPLQTIKIPQDPRNASPGTRVICIIQISEVMCRPHVKARSFHQPIYPRHGQSSASHHVSSETTPRLELRHVCIPHPERSEQSDERISLEHLPQLEWDSSTASMGRRLTAIRSSTEFAQIFTPPS